MFYLALTLAHIADWFIQAFDLGAGSTWPGEIALRVDPQFIAHLLAHNTVKPIIIAGTNGKTTTSLLITQGLIQKGYRVITNPEGANLVNGIASSLIKRATLSGTVTADFAVWESDENAFTQITQAVQKPYLIVFLNLFRDQLDRYGEVHSIAARWKEALQSVDDSTVLVGNGDDPRIAYLMRDWKKAHFFGASGDEKKQTVLTHDVDSIYCPSCGAKLEYAGSTYSHLGNYRCISCGFRTPTEDNEPVEDLPHLKGIYNRYNVRAALMALQTVCQISQSEALTLISQVRPAFGRQEIIEYQGKKWVVTLSKNPAGFNQSIQVIPELVNSTKTSVLIVLNDRIPDGTDVSWIWDVEFEKVYDYATDVWVTGDRTYDMAIRLQKEIQVPNSNSNSILRAEEDLKKAIDLIAQNHQSATPIIVLATYTGMLAVRKILTGRALL